MTSQLSQIESHCYTSVNRKDYASSEVEGHHALEVESTLVEERKSKKSQQKTQLPEQSGSGKPPIPKDNSHTEANIHLEFMPCQDPAQLTHTQQRFERLHLYKFPSEPPYLSPSSILSSFMPHSSSTPTSHTTTRQQFQRDPKFKYAQTHILSHPSRSHESMYNRTTEKSKSETSDKQRKHKRTSGQQRKHKRTSGQQGKHERTSDQQRTYFGTIKESVAMEAPYIAEAVVNSIQSSYNKGHLDITEVKAQLGPLVMALAQACCRSAYSPHIIRKLQSAVDKWYGLHLLPPQLQPLANVLTYGTIKSVFEIIKCLFQHKISSVDACTQIFNVLGPSAFQAYGCYFGGIIGGIIGCTGGPAGAVLGASVGTWVGGKLGKSLWELIKEAIICIVQYIRALLKC